MRENTAMSELGQWIERVTIIVGLLIPLIKQFAELVKALAELLSARGDPARAQELRQQVSKKTGRFGVWLVVVFGTLVVPSGAIISVTMSIASAYLARNVSEWSLFASQLSSVTGAIGAIYPLVWGIYIYPIFRDYFHRQDQNA
jgi:hypothetical protein